MRFWVLGGVVCVLCLGVFGCSTLLPNVDPKAEGPPAPPPILGAFESDPPVATVDDWKRRAPLLRKAFEQRIYGALPPPGSPRVIVRSAPTVPGLNARVEQWTVAVTEDDPPLRFNLVLVLPPQGDGPFPTIVMQNFCGNRAAFRGRPKDVARPLTGVMSACDDPKWDPVIESIFGRHIAVPPYDRILERGYAVAMFYAGDVVADVAGDAPATLTRLSQPDAPLGAIGAWAWLYSRAYDVLAEDSRIDSGRVAIWGHSRNGKAALVAAAFDERIAAVISHQSGRGGAALNQGPTGETIHAMMGEYPHWFTPAYGELAAHPAFDQHQLLALIAPRPVLLGNGRRDAHADPLGQFRAAQAADPVYELLGAKGLDQEDPVKPALDADLSFFLRPGLHGVHSEDWTYFLDFLDAHFTPASRAEAQGAVNGTGRSGLGAPPTPRDP